MERLVIWLLVALAKGLYRLIAWIVRRTTGALRAEPRPAPRPQRPPRPAQLPARPGLAPRSVSTRPTHAQQLQRALDEMRAGLEPQLLALEAERTSHRFAAPLRAWVDERVASARHAASHGGLRPEQLNGLFRELQFVLRVVDRLAEQRKVPELAASLGDADTLAMACYAPTLRWARAENLPLAASEPATLWGDFDLSIWIGFQPTGVAPIFLPPDFFARAAWWPALAHELAHSFLASSPGLDSRLRRDLALPSEALGRRPLVFDGRSLAESELDRVFGGWFEEIFCDVYGTLMLGPAYLATMHALFAAPAGEDPRQVQAVDVDEEVELYGPHPPRHLRMIAGCRVLERVGLEGEGRRRRAAWEQRHALDGKVPDRILFPGEHGGYLAIGLPLLEERLVALVDRLVDGPLPALSGMSLADVGGLGYGPHEQQESLRARSSLIAGQVPKVRDPRAVIAGLVLAVHDGDRVHPDEARLLVLARRAIPALGTTEHREDAFSPATKLSRKLDANMIRDAMILSAILERPAARR